MKRTPFVRPFAAFLVAPVFGAPQMLAATTRPGGRIGLPGGKLDPNETAEQAVRREAREEGWIIAPRTRLTLAHADFVEKRLVVWFLANKPVRPAQTWKEAYRGIRPIALPIQTVARSGYGNEWLYHFTFTSKLK